MKQDRQKVFLMSLKQQTLIIICNLMVSINFPVKYAAQGEEKK